MSNIYPDKGVWTDVNWYALQSKTLSIVLRIALGVLGSLLVIGLCYFYYRVFLTVPKNSDQAAPLLMAQDFLAGNFFMKGWWLGTDNFYTLDLLWIAMCEKLLGFTPLLMSIVPAIVYTTIVVVSLVFIYALSEKNNKFLSVLIGMCWLIFPGVGAPIESFSLLPAHLVTSLYMLLIVWILGNIKNLWWSCIAFGLLLLCNIGDPFSYFLGNVAILIGAFTIHSLTKKEQSIWVAISVVSLIMAVIIKKIIVSQDVILSGWLPKFNSLDHVGISIRFILQGLLAFFNGDVFDQPLYSVATLLKMIHLVLFLIGIKLLAQFSWKMKNVNQEVSTQYKFFSLLAITIVVDLGMCIFSDRMKAVSTIRFLYPLFFSMVIFSAIKIPTLIKKNHKIYVALMLVFVGIQGNVFYNNIKAMPTYIPPNQVEQYLISHHLVNGYAQFWLSQTTTVNTSQRVIIREVTAARPDHLIDHGGFQSKKTWYQNYNANFLIFNDTNDGYINSNTAFETFGPPQQKITVDGVHIWIWDHNISPQLGKRWQPI